MVNHAIGIINKKSPIFEMKNVKIHIYNNNVVLSASDTDNYINITRTNEYNAEDSMDLCVSGQILQSVVKSMEGVIELSCNNNYLVLKDKQGSFKIKSFSSKNFPVHEPSKQLIFSIDGLTLSNLLKSVNINISDEDFGITRLLCENKLLSIVVNDRKRLSFTKLEIDADDFDIVLSAKASQEIMKSVSSKCDVYGENNQFTFQTKDITLITRAVNTRYLINHNKFISKQEYTEFSLDCKAVLNAIKRSLLMSQIINKIINIKIEKDTMEFSGLDISVGDSKNTFAIENDQINGSISVNGAFLLSAISTISSKKVNIYFKSGFDPLLIQDHEGVTTHVLMPVRVGYNV